MAGRLKYCLQTVASKGQALGFMVALTWKKVTFAYYLVKVVTFTKRFVILTLAKDQS